MTTKSSDKKNISNEVKSELPLLHQKFFKKFRGNHNFLNKYMYLSDGVKENLVIFSSKNIEFQLVSLLFDSSMHPTFKYLFQDKDSGLCSAAWLIETIEGLKVKKIESDWT